MYVRSQHLESQDQRPPILIGQLPFDEEGVRPILFRKTQRLGAGRRQAPRPAKPSEFRANAASGCGVMLDNYRGAPSPGIERDLAASIAATSISGASWRRDPRQPFKNYPHAWVPKHTVKRRQLDIPDAFPRVQPSGTEPFPACRRVLHSRRPAVRPDILSREEYAAAEVFDHTSGFPPNTPVRRCLSLGPLIDRTLARSSDCGA